ncbi:unnamed protein product [Nyctereutes procyonoides]|uniref:(raccoon dog) hypothetical protein n=1 Tax=Nyctereutes procyonoides TaxID=34880 RepID=A0A811ZIZ3_NYCPR|nr:unnamed protein product [Nyctereutes procyonoides]
MTAARCPGRSAPRAAASPRGFESSSSPPSRPRRPESSAHGGRRSSDARGRRRRARPAALPAPRRSGRGRGTSSARNWGGLEFPPHARVFRPRKAAGERRPAGSGARGLGPAARTPPTATGRGASPCRRGSCGHVGRWCPAPGARSLGPPGSPARLPGRGDASGSRAGAPRPAGGESDTGVRTGTRPFGGLPAGPCPLALPQPERPALGSCAGRVRGAAPGRRGRGEVRLLRGVRSETLRCQDAAQGACRPHRRRTRGRAPQQMARAPSLPRTSPFRGAGTASGRHSHVPRERPLRAHLPAPSPGPLLPGRWSAPRLQQVEPRGCRRQRPRPAPPPAPRPRGALPALFSARGSRLSAGPPGAAALRGPPAGPGEGAPAPPDAAAPAWVPRPAAPGVTAPGSGSDWTARGARGGISAPRRGSRIPERSPRLSAPHPRPPDTRGSGARGNHRGLPRPRVTPRSGAVGARAPGGSVGTHAARPGRGQPLCPSPIF